MKDKTKKGLITLYRRLKPARKLAERLPVLYQARQQKFKARLYPLWQRAARRPFLMLVLLPWLLAALYLVALKTPQYESHAQLVIEKNDISNALMVNIGFLGKSGGEANNIYLTKDFIQSQAMYQLLDKKLHLTEYFSSKRIDALSRLKADAKLNERVAYFNKKIDVIYEPTSNKLDLAARAFDANFAQAMLKEIVKQTRYFSNRVSNRLANAQHEFATSQLTLAKEHLYLAEKKIVEFQNKSGVFDPKQTIKVTGELMAGLKAELLKKQTELISYSSYMQPTTGKIIALKQSIKALKQQIKQQTMTLLGGKSDKMNKLLADFQWQEMDLKFALAEYEGAQKSFDLSAMNLAKKQNLVIEIMRPDVADDYSYPKISYDLFSLLLGLLVLFVLLKMTFLIVQEHID